MAKLIQQSGSVRLISACLINKHPVPNIKQVYAAYKHSEVFSILLSTCSLAVSQPIDVWVDGNLTVIYKIMKIELAHWFVVTMNIYETAIVGTTLHL